jgi:hypothetical protein
MRKTALIVTAAALLPLALAACSSSDTLSASTASAPQQAVTPTATSSAAPTATTSRAPGSAGACAASDFKADLNTQPDGGIAMLALTNKSSKTCSLRGWAVVSFLGADNGAVDVPVKKVAQPGPATDVTLKSGQTTFAGFKWTTCDKSAESCKVATTVQITPPGVSSPIVADFIGAKGGNEKVNELDLSAAQIGTLQPSNEGVVAW